MGVAQSAGALDGQQMDRKLMEGFWQSAQAWRGQLQCNQRGWLPASGQVWHDQRAHWMGNRWQTTDGGILAICTGVGEGECGAISGCLEQTADMFVKRGCHLQ